MGTTQVFAQHPSSSPPSSSSSSSSLREVSRSISETTSSSFPETADDATSSASTLMISSDLLSSLEGYRERGPLCELSELMTHLPIKRGLSMHYWGKSQSFTSLASARSLEDLAKKENPHAKRLKLCTGWSSAEDCGRRSLSYSSNGEAKAAAVLPSKRHDLLKTPINNRPSISIVRTF